MVQRLKFQKILEEILGSRNVYFQPPETLKLKYPCIVYNMSSPNVLRANDGIYRTMKCYNVTLIHEDPDNTIWEKLLEVQYSSPIKLDYVADNLHHYQFEIYY